MDLAYWGFCRWPFQRRRSAHDNVGTSHEEVLARLLFLVDERRPCGILTGPAGTGKSGLLRQVASYARRQGRTCLEIDATGIGASELAFGIADQFHRDCDIQSTVHQCWSLVQQQLVCQAVIGQPIVVMIDHMEGAEPGAAIALRRLMNLAETSATELTLLIAARPTWRDAEMAARADLTIGLGQWTLDQTAGFIEEALKAAGAMPGIFSRDALATIQDLSRGNPGDIVRICDLSLLAAMGDGKRKIDAGLVNSAALELSVS